MVLSHPSLVSATGHLEMATSAILGEGRRMCLLMTTGRGPLLPQWASRKTTFHYDNRRGRKEVAGAQISLRSRDCHRWVGSGEEVPPPMVHWLCPELVRVAGRCGEEAS